MKSALTKIWALFTPKERRKALIMFMLAISMALFEALGVVSIMPFLSVLSRPEMIQEQVVLKTAYSLFKASSETEFIAYLGVCSITIVLIASSVKTITQHALNRFNNFQRHAISTRLLQKYLDQPYEFFIGRNSADLTKNVLSETDQLIFNIVQPLTLIIAQGAIVITISLLIVFYDPKTALAALVVVGLMYGLIYTSVRKKLGKIGIEVVEANKERYKSCNEAIGGIRDIKLTQAAPIFLERYNSASRTYARHFATSDTLSQTPLYLAEATGYSGLILIALYSLAESNNISQILPALGLYGFAAYRLLPATQIMYRGFARIKFTSAALNNIFRDISLETPTINKSAEPIAPKHNIKLMNIFFSYPSEQDKPIFSDFSLEIEAQTVLGICGKSGEGKSTLIDILLGLIQPQQGSLWVDDVRITKANAHGWQRSIGYVPQQIYLTDTSIASNIAFGVPEEQINWDALYKASQAAQIHEFIVNQLPNSYATIVGDRGIRLSGGQRQRIGIARALYKDPPILFMDEATSALDDETETELNNAIANLSANKTIIVIAHKRSTLEKCTKVINLTNLKSNMN